MMTVKIRFVYDVYVDVPAEKTNPTEWAMETAEIIVKDLEGLRLLAGRMTIDKMIIVKDTNVPGAT